MSGCGCNARPIRLESGCWTHFSWVRTLDPSVLAYAVSWDLSLCSCHSQVTWIRCTFPTPSSLGLEGDVRPKLISEYDCNTRSKSFGPILKVLARALGLAVTPDPLDVGKHVGPICLGSVCLT
jgi:hypothetical protein